ncbi:hypothetical protein GGS21DRAFT_504642 [Xylaria nigripes]|nr:hypothetical protein GGS21DRAFT_504642 [Xylaria nigripes]
MTSRTYFSSDAYRRHPAQPLHHKVSDISENSDSPGPLHRRESLISLQSLYESPPLPPPKEPALEQRWYAGEPSSIVLNESSSGRYQLVPPPLSSTDRFRSFPARIQDTIHEDESIDMSLLGAALPPCSYYSYNSVPSDEPVEPGTGTTSLSRTTNVLGSEYLTLSPGQARGRLSEDLGHRDVPGTKLRSQGFEEAINNEDISEVITEQPADRNPIVDQYSSVPIPPQHPLQCPDHNWKPFFIRWPYLIFMVILSILLAIVQETIYHLSRRQGGLFHFTNTQDFDPGLYAVFKFVPIIITVIYGVLWQLADSEIRRLEAFYQMSKEGGASAAESINMDYISPFNLTRLFLIYRGGHYAVTVSSLATLLAVLLVPTLAAATFVLNPDWVIRQPNSNEGKVIAVSVIPSRLLTAAFVVDAISACVLLYQVTSRNSGLKTDVKGIAGLASMTVDSNIMMDFKDMDTAKPQDISKRLKNRRYELRDSSIFPEEFMLVNGGGNDTLNNIRLSESSHPLMLRFEGCMPFIIGMILFLVLILVFLFTSANVIIHKAPWLVTLLAVCMKLAWGNFDTSIRMLEPYYILAKRHAPAKTLTLDYTAMPFAIVAIRAIFNRHWIVFLVSFGSVLAELLTIFSTSLAQVGGKDFVDLAEAHDDPLPSQGLTSGSRTAHLFIAMLGLTAGIVLYLCVVAFIVFVCRRRPILPRQPNTIASVLAYLHQSKMLYDFVQTSGFTDKEIHEKLDALGKMYGLGWFIGRDGQEHCGVDEEEITGSYKHYAGRKWDNAMD